MTENSSGQSSIRLSRYRYLLVIFQLGSLLAFVVTLYVGWQITKPLNISPERIYHYESGQNISQFAENLNLDGYLDNTDLFIWTAQVGGIDRVLKAGEYSFKSDYSVLGVLDHLVQGKSVSYPIQFIEGWTFQDYLDELRTKSNIKHTFAELSHTQIVDQLGIAESSPEGLFFPDTYRYTSGRTDSSILKKAYDTMQEILQTEWETRQGQLPFKTPYESLVAASIIEMESRVAEEFPLVASVIVNRLNRGMKLQMDPTVVYGLNGLNIPLNRKHLAKDTPYNTYTRFGLPPTPISMPGMAAIKAALNPADSSALYFVARGDGTGTHKFSDTYDEHIIAVRAYRKSEEYKQLRN